MPDFLDNLYKSINERSNPNYSYAKSSYGQSQYDTAPAYAMQEAAPKNQSFEDYLNNNRDRLQPAVKQFTNSILGPLTSVATKFGSGFETVTRFALDKSIDSYNQLTNSGNPKSNLTNFNYLDSLEEGMKNYFELYPDDNYTKENNPFKKAITAYGFSHDVLDGAAYLVSAIGGGKIAASAGASVAGALGTKMLTKLATSTILQETALGVQLGKAGKFLEAGNLAKMEGAVRATYLLENPGSLEALNALQKVSYTAGSVLLEGATEAKETYKTLYEKAVSSGMHHDQAVEVATTGSQETFLANVAVLALSNYWEAGVVYGRYNKNLSAYVRDTLSGETIKPMLKGLAPKVLEGFVMEGLWEENMQTAIQQYERSYTPENKLPFLSTVFSNGIKGVDAFTQSLDFSKQFEGDALESSLSIWLGGMLGGGMSLFQANTENSDMRNQSKAMIDKANELKLQSVINGFDKSIENPIEWMLHNTNSLINGLHAHNSLESKDPLYHEYNRSNALSAYAMQFNSLVHSLDKETRNKVFDSIPLGDLEDNRQDIKDILDKYDDIYTTNFDKNASLDKNLENRRMRDILYLNNKIDFLESRTPLELNDDGTPNQKYEDYQIFLNDQKTKLKEVTNSKMYHQEFKDLQAKESNLYAQQVKDLRDGRDIQNNTVYSDKFKQGIATKNLGLAREVNKRKAKTFLNENPLSTDPMEQLESLDKIERSDSIDVSDGSSIKSRGLMLAIDIENNHRLDTTKLDEHLESLSINNGENQFTTTDEVEQLLLDIFPFTSPEDAAEVGALLDSLNSQADSIGEIDETIIDKELNEFLEKTKEKANQIQNINNRANQVIDKIKNINDLEELDEASIFEEIGVEQTNYNALVTAGANASSFAIENAIRVLRSAEEYYRDSKIISSSAIRDMLKILMDIKYLIDNAAKLREEEQDLFLSNYLTRISRVVGKPITSINDILDIKGASLTAEIDKLIAKHYPKLGVVDIKNDATIYQRLFMSHLVNEYNNTIKAEIGVTITQDEYEEKLEFFTENFNINLLPDSMEPAKDIYVMLQLQKMLVLNKTDILEKEAAYLRSSKLGLSKQQLVNLRLLQGNIQAGKAFIKLEGSAGCLGLGTKVLMFDGSFKEAQDINVGDELMGIDSTPRTVQELKRGTEQMYWVHQVKGQSYRVNENHILSLKEVKSTKYERKTIEGKRYLNKEVINHQKEVSTFNIKLSDYLNTEDAVKKSCKGYQTEAIEFAQKDLIIDPYYLGLWLGDGNTRDIKSITNIDSEIINYLSTYGIRRSQKITYTIEHDTLKDDFKKLYNLTNASKLEKKYIPQQYLTSTIEDRLQLLAGLLDSGGHHSKIGKYYQISSKHKDLADQIEYLSRSLGFKVNKTIKIVKSDKFKNDEYINYILTIIVDREIPCKVERKKNEVRLQVKNIRHTGINIEKDTVDDYYGFTLDGDNLFILEDFTVTHNTGKTSMLKTLIASIGDTKFAAVSPSKSIESLGLKKHKITSTDSFEVELMAYATDKDVATIIIDEAYLYDNDSTSSKKNTNAIITLINAGKNIIVVGDSAQNSKESNFFRLKNGQFLKTLNDKSYNHVYLNPLTVSYRVDNTGVMQLAEQFRNRLRPVKDVTVFNNGTEGSFSSKDINKDYNDDKATDKLLITIDNYLTSQGTEADTVYVAISKTDFAKEKEYNAAMYTAITRAKKKVVILNADVIPGPVDVSYPSISNEFSRNFNYHAELLKDYVGVDPIVSNIIPDTSVAATSTFTPGDKYRDEMYPNDLTFVNTDDAEGLNYFTSTDPDTGEEVTIGIPIVVSVYQQPVYSYGDTNEVDRVNVKYPSQVSSEKLAQYGLDNTENLNDSFITVGKKQIGDSYVYNEIYVTEIPQGHLILGYGDEVAEPTDSARVPLISNGEIGLGLYNPKKITLHYKNLKVKYSKTKNENLIESLNKSVNNLLGPNEVYVGETKYEARIVTKNLKDSLESVFSRAVVQRLPLGRSILLFNIPATIRFTDEATEEDKIEALDLVRSISEKVNNNQLGKEVDAYITANNKQDLKSKFLVYKESRQLFVNLFSQKYTSKDNEVQVLNKWHSLLNEITYKVDGADIPLSMLDFNSLLDKLVIPSKANNPIYDNNLNRIGNDDNFSDNAKLDELVRAIYKSELVEYNYSVPQIISEFFNENESLEAFYNNQLEFKLYNTKAVELFKLEKQKYDENPAYVSKVKFKLFVGNDNRAIEKHIIRKSGAVPTILERMATANKTLGSTSGIEIKKRFGLKITLIDSTKIITKALSFAPTENTELAHAYKAILHSYKEGISKLTEEESKALNDIYSEYIHEVSKDNVENFNKLWFSKNKDVVKQLDSLFSKIKSLNANVYLDDVAEVISKEGYSKLTLEEFMGFVNKPGGYINKWLSLDEHDIFKVVDDKITTVPSGGKSFNSLRGGETDSELDSQVYSYLENLFKTELSYSVDTKAFKVKDLLNTSSPSENFKYLNKLLPEGYKDLNVLIKYIDGPTSGRYSEDGITLFVNKKDSLYTDNIEKILFHEIIHKYSVNAISVGSEYLHKQLTKEHASLVKSKEVFYFYNVRNIAKKYFNEKEDKEFTNFIGSLQESSTLNIFNNLSPSSIRRLLSNPSSRIKFIDSVENGITIKGKDLTIDEKVHFTKLLLAEFVANTSSPLFRDSKTLQSEFTTRTQSKVAKYYSYIKDIAKAFIELFTKPSNSDFILSYLSQLTNEVTSAISFDIPTIEPSENIIETDIYEEDEYNASFSNKEAKTLVRDLFKGYFRSYQTKNNSIDYAKKLLTFKNSRGFNRTLVNVMYSAYTTTESKEAIKKILFKDKLAINPKLVITEAEVVSKLSSVIEEISNEEILKLDGETYGFAEALKDAVSLLENVESKKDEDVLLFLFNQVLALEKNEPLVEIMPETFLTKEWLFDEKGKSVNQLNSLINKVRLMYSKFYKMGLNKNDINQNIQTALEKENIKDGSLNSYLVESLLTLNKNGENMFKNVISALINSNYSKIETETEDRGMEQLGALNDFIDRLKNSSESVKNLFSLIPRPNGKSFYNFSQVWITGVKLLANRTFDLDSYKVDMPQFLDTVESSIIKEINKLLYNVNSTKKNVNYGVELHNLLTNTSQTYLTEVAALNLLATKQNIDDMLSTGVRVTVGPVTVPLSLSSFARNPNEGTNIEELNKLVEIGILLKSNGVYSVSPTDIEDFKRFAPRLLKSNTARISADINIITTNNGYEIFTINYLKSLTKTERDKIGALITKSPLELNDLVNKGLVVSSTQYNKNRAIQYLSNLEVITPDGIKKIKDTQNAIIAGGTSKVLGLFNEVVTNIIDFNRSLDSVKDLQNNVLSLTSKEYSLVTKDGDLLPAEETSLDLIIKNRMSSLFYSIANHVVEERQKLDKNTVNFTNNTVELNKFAEDTLKVFKSSLNSLGINEELGKKIVSLIVNKVEVKSNVEGKLILTNYEDRKIDGGLIKGVDSYIEESFKTDLGKVVENAMENSPDRSASSVRDAGKNSIFKYTMSSFADSILYNLKSKFSRMKEVVPKHYTDDKLIDNNLLLNKTLSIKDYFFYTGKDNGNIIRRTDYLSTSPEQLVELMFIKGFLGTLRFKEHTNFFMGPVGDKTKSIHVTANLIRDKDTSLLDSAVNKILHIKSYKKGNKNIMFSIAKGDNLTSELVKERLSLQADIFLNDLKAKGLFKSAVTYLTNPNVLSRLELDSKYQYVKDGNETFEYLVKEAAKIYIANNIVYTYSLTEATVSHIDDFKNDFDLLKRLTIAFGPGVRSFLDDQFGVKKEFKYLTIPDRTYSYDSIRANLSKFITDESKLKFLLRDFVDKVNDELTQEQRDVIGIDLTDAQTYMSNSFYKNFIKGTGVSYGISHINKPIYADGLTNIKTGTIAITDELMAKYPAFKELNNLLEAADIDLIGYETSSKKGSQDTKKVATEIKGMVTDETNLLDYQSSIKTLQTKFFRLQLNPHSTSTSVSLPTQLMYFLNFMGNPHAKLANDSWAKIIKKGLAEFKLDLAENSLFYLTNAKEKTQELVDAGVSYMHPLVYKDVVSSYNSTIQRYTTGKLKFQKAKKCVLVESSFFTDSSGNPIPAFTEQMIDGVKTIVFNVIGPKSLITHKDSLYDGIAWRIPSTEIHSAILYKIVDSIEGNIMICPPELVHLHGSDFDIDSLFAASYEKDKHGNVYGSTSDREITSSTLDKTSETEEGLRNLILYSIFKTLAEPSYNERMLNSISTDNIARAANKPLPMHKDLEESRFLTYNKETIYVDIVDGVRTYRDFDNQTIFPNEKELFEYAGQKPDLSLQHGIVSAQQSIANGTKSTGQAANVPKLAANLINLANLFKFDKNTADVKAAKLEALYKELDITPEDKKDTVRQEILRVENEEVKRQILTWLGKPLTGVINSLEGLSMSDSFINSAIDNLKKLELDGLGINKKTRDIVFALLLFNQITTDDDLSIIKQVFTNPETLNYLATGGTLQLNLEILENGKYVTKKMNLTEELANLKLLNKDLLPLLSFLSITKSMPNTEEDIKTVYNNAVIIRNNETTFLDLVDLFEAMPHLKELDEVLKNIESYFNSSINETEIYKNMEDFTELGIEDSSVKDLIFSYFVETKIKKDISDLAYKAIFSTNNQTKSTEDKIEALNKHILSKIRKEISKSHKVDLPNTMLYHMDIKEGELKFKLPSSMKDQEKLYFEASFLGLIEQGENVDIANMLVIYALLNNLFTFSLSSFSQFIPMSVLKSSKTLGTSYLDVIIESQARLNVPISDSNLSNYIDHFKIFLGMSAELVRRDKSVIPLTESKTLSYDLEYVTEVTEFNEDTNYIKIKDAFGIKTTEDKENKIGIYYSINKLVKNKVVPSLPAKELKKIRKYLSTNKKTVIISNEDIAKQLKEYIGSEKTINVKKGYLDINNVEGNSSRIFYDVALSSEDFNPEFFTDFKDRYKKVYETISINPATKIEEKTSYYTYLTHGQKKDVYLIDNYDKDDSFNPEYVYFYDKQYSIEKAKFSAYPSMEFTTRVINNSYRDTYATYLIKTNDKGEVQSKTFLPESSKLDKEIALELENKEKKCVE